jgi:hypothetical protein
MVMAMRKKIMKRCPHCDGKEHEDESRALHGSDKVGVNV